MKITTELVEYIAGLSRLKLPTDEVEQMATQLERIIGYIGVLEELDTTQVEAKDHILDLEHVLRADEVADSLDRAGLLACAPATDGEAFLVPKAVD